MATIFTAIRLKGATARVIASVFGQHPSFTALAVAHEGGTVSFYQEEVRARGQRARRAPRASSAASRGRHAVRHSGR